eukprot:g13889.t1
MVADHVTDTCFACARQLDKPVVTRRCSQCLSARFCGVDCQREYWKKGHKKICKKTQQDKKDGQKNEPDKKNCQKDRPVKDDCQKEEKGRVGRQESAEEHLKLLRQVGAHAAFWEKKWDSREFVDGMQLSCSRSLVHALYQWGVKSPQTFNPTLLEKHTWNVHLLGASNFECDSDWQVVFDACPNLSQLDFTCVGFTGTHSQVWSHKADYEGALNYYLEQDGRPAANGRPAVPASRRAVRTSKRLLRGLYHQVVELYPPELFQEETSEKSEYPRYRLPVWAAFGRAAADAAMTRGRADAEPDRAALARPDLALVFCPGLDIDFLSWAPTLQLLAKQHVPCFIWGYNKDKIPTQLVVEHLQLQVVVPMQINPFSIEMMGHVKNHHLIAFRGELKGNQPLLDMANRSNCMVLLKKLVQEHNLEPHPDLKPTLRYKPGRPTVTRDPFHSDTVDRTCPVNVPTLLHVTKTAVSLVSYYLVSLRLYEWQVPIAPQASLDLLCNPDWTDAEVNPGHRTPRHNHIHSLIEPDWSDNSAAHRTFICDYDPFEPPFDVFDSWNSYADFVNADTTLSPDIYSHADTSKTDV